MKASDIDKVQGLLADLDEHKAWLNLTGELLSPKPDSSLPCEFVVEVDNDQLALPTDTGIGREILALVKRYAEDKIGGIEAELRTMGVEP